MFGDRFFGRRFFGARFFGPSAPTEAIDITDGSFVLTATITCRDLDSLMQLYCAGVGSFGLGAFRSAEMSQRVSSDTNIGIGRTGTKAIDVTLEWPEALAGHSLTIESAVIELLG